MKGMAITWICWSLLLYTSLTEARHKRRGPAPPQSVFKKLGPIGPRIPIGNRMHITGNFLRKRMSYKSPLSHRIRRPTPILDVLPNTWKKQVQVPSPIKLNNQAFLPHHPPVRDFNAVNKLPEFDNEYRGESVVLPPIQRGAIDDDRSPIHTIPAPNLNPVDKSYPRDTQIENISEEPSLRHHYINNGNYNTKLKAPSSVDFEVLATTSSILPTIQNTISINPFSIQNHYEVTESSAITQDMEYRPLLPAVLSPAVKEDIAKVTILNSDLQTVEGFLNHPMHTSSSLINTNIQYGQTDAPMQTNLHSSLHVGFPGTAAEVQYALNPVTSNQHNKNVALTDPQLSATHLYEILNSLPQHLTTQYTTVPEPQLQQHLSEILQPVEMVNFSQPQLQSFNYDEQTDNKHQQAFINQKYDPSESTGGYSTGSDSSANEEATNHSDLSNKVAYLSNTVELPENHVEYKDTTSDKIQTTYFNKVSSNGGISTNFYSILPNREAAEKLAALAAAGNVNSHLITRLRKQDLQRESSFADNDRNDYHTNQDQIRKESINYIYNNNERLYEQNDKGNEDLNDEQQEEQEYNEEHHIEQVDAQRTRLKMEKTTGHEDNYIYNHRRPQQSKRIKEENNKRPLRIMIPDDKYTNNGNNQRSDIKMANDNVEYDFEDSEPVTISTNHKQSTNAEFGTRIRSTARK